MMTLAEYLAENKINRSAFATQVGSTPSTISRVCNGKRFPGRQLIKRIHVATAGMVTVEDLLFSATTEDIAHEIDDPSSRKSQEITP